MQLSAIVEAILLASEDPLPCEEIARLVRSRVAEADEARAATLEDGQQAAELPDWLTALGAVSADDAAAAISELVAHYDTSGRAFTILERPKGWKLYTRPEYGEFVRQMFPGRKPERLSGPAMETLAIIAYRQPVTKAAIEAVRGVSCDGMLQKLLDRDLVRIGGRAELPGRPLLYETTELFFEHFGIRSIDELPNATELRRVKLPEPEQEIPIGDSERQLALSATGSPAAGHQPEESPETAANHSENP
jgi:segregation and condensation protein B